VRFGEVGHRPIVSIDSASTVAEVDGFLVDPVAKRVGGLQLRKSKGGAFVAWEDLHAFGAEAVTIDSVGLLREPNDEEKASAAKGAFGLIGGRVLTTGGRDLGTVSDVEFDPESGRLVTIVLAGEGVGGERLVAIGFYAVVVDEA
jgi:uncharacterized protein YrrD